ncbi:transient receptor potential cation channel subfamily A member 1 homolog isoform X2 [Littorina saxatilis]|uniref:transient receptor potential cation channel subfamily A member 1 homolog isoform X2 n=1 Tax=Littorina saxatilis TaxID=31220 RepID=UPI0038B4841D
MATGAGTYRPMEGEDKGMEMSEGPRGGGAGGGGDQPGMKKSESSEVLNLTLHQCARDGDEYNMKILVRHMGSNIKKKINQYDEDDLTPLHYAARYNFLGVVKLLVENGADVNRRGEDDVTPLHHAARYRREKHKKREPTAEQNQDEPGLNGIPLLEQYEAEFGQATESVISYLISKGADTNARDIYGQTPLHFAAMRGNEIACRDLLSIRGIEIEAQDKQGIAPLHMAAIHNQVEVAKMLIEAGANLRCIDLEQCTPLHYACAEGNMDLVQALFEAGAKTPEAWVMISNMVTDQDVEGSTCLHVAVDNGHYETAKTCLEKRAEVNRPRKHYMYPLHLAAMSGDIRIARLLVENSARIDVVNDEQATALHKAAGLNHVEVVKFLVDRGARINRRDKDNYTPLLLAATYGHVETVELLVQKGADYTAVDKYDKTVIYLAAEENKLAVLEKLLSYPQLKRLINVTDQYDSTPLHIASQQGYLDVVKLLLENGADIDSKNEEEQTPVHLAAKFGRTNIVREIVRRDKSVLNDEDENSNTALHLSAQFGHNKVAAILLELGADVSARNYNQWTPLDLAASKGWTKTCSVLLENDAPVDPTDKNKVTPLHLAARYGHPRAVELLLDWEADVGLEDTEGQNCLDLAIENNHSNVAMRIINSDVWQQALRNSTEDPVTGRIDTPMRKLIKKMPDVAERCFDRCLNYGQEKNPERPLYEITFNYEFLDDTYMPWIHAEYRKRMRSDDTSSMSDTSSLGSVFDEDDRLLPSARPYSSDSNFLKKNSPLYIMVSSEREILLDHPLVTSLLNHKWNTFGRFFYYLSLFIYCIFLTFLTGYIVQTEPPQNYGNDSAMLENNMCDNLTRTYSQHLFSQIGTYVILALAAFNLLKEMLQIYQAKLAYLGWTNLIEWTTYITALLLVVSFNECQRTTGYRYEWQWSLGAISVFLAWINLVLFIQKFPALGIYVVMFTDVLYTFAQFFAVFFLFIVAFAMAFYTVLQQQDPFTNVPKSLIKTSVMMIGEFEFDAIFNTPEENRVLYVTVSYIIFVAFLIIMSILLMNLLVGLAVDDIKAVQEQAALKRMAMQVELALDVERVIPDFIRRKAFVKKKTIRPNTMFKNPFTRIFITQTGLTAKSLQEHLNPELDEIEKVQEGQKKLNGDVKKLKRTVKDLRETNQRIESMLKAILRANKIDWQDEDYQEEDEVDQIEAGLSY